ncbi:MAG: HNH endonuclease [Chloroflexi bacterium]|nr:HNH endonuclease [Chloroflexota bacterium]
MSHIPQSLRRLVFERAAGRCEYCLVHSDDLPTSHHVDHIVPLKHGGSTIESNLALACPWCNRRKGSDLTAIDPLDETIIPLFNPRVQIWSDHLALDGAQIVGRTTTGRATVALLRLNDSPRVAQRQWLIDAGRYPRQ